LGPDQKYEYGGVPPKAWALACPSSELKQVDPVTVYVASSDESGSVILIELFASQLFASVTFK